MHLSMQEPHHCCTAVRRGGEAWRAADSNARPRRIGGTLGSSSASLPTTPSSRSSTRASRPHRYSASASPPSTAASSPAIATIKTAWGTRLIPKDEIDRYLAERTEEPRAPRGRPGRSGRRPTLPPDIVARIRRERRQGATLGEIARGLNRDDIPTAQGGCQWWASTVRAILLRSEQLRA